MQKFNFQEDRTVRITPDRILSTLEKHVTRISAAQRSYLAVGICDSATKSALADMVVEIVQVLSVDVLKQISPVIQELKTTQSDLGTSDEYIKVSLGDSICVCIAALLHIPLENCESCRELTALIEKEISKKVNSIVPEIFNGSVWPSEPAVYVSGSLSTMKMLHDMVFHTAACLKRHLGREDTKSLGLRRCPKRASLHSRFISASPPELLETEEPLIHDSQQEKSPPPNTEGMTGIIPKHSFKSDIERTFNPAPLSASMTEKIRKAATELVKVAATSPHYYKSEDSDTDTSIRIINNVDLSDLVDSTSVTSEDEKFDDRLGKYQFSKFAKTQFEKMVERVKRLNANNSEFLVNLTQDSSYSPQGSTESSLGYLSGCSTSTSLSPVVTSTTAGFIMKKQQSCENGFDTIKSQVECLFDEFIQADKPAEKVLEAIKCSDKIRTFSKELINMIYNEVMTGPAYQIPIVPVGRALSDSVRSKIKSTTDTGTQFFSPDVLYAVTEDAVGKFLQNLLLWKQKIPDQKSPSEEICNVLNDAGDLITEKVTPSEGVVTSQGLKTSKAQSARPSDTKPKSYPHEISESDDLDKNISFSQNHLKAVGIISACDEKSEEVKPSVQIPSSESMSSDIITTLFMRLIINFSKKTRKSMKTHEVRKILTHLSNKVIEEVDLNNSVVKVNHDNMKQITEAVLKDLRKEFGSMDKTLSAAMRPNDTSFENTVVKYLKIHVSVRPSPKRSVVARFLIAVGKALVKPFKCFKPHLN